MTVIDEITAERKRQIEVEVWTSEHDDEHERGELGKAAACYADFASDEDYLLFLCKPGLPYDWPWDEKWWKPKNRRRDLIRAAALIVAEIERLDRAVASPKETNPAE